MRKTLSRQRAAKDSGEVVIKNLRPPREATHSYDGVDLTLIRWMLSLTPTERLQVLQHNIASILRLRGDGT
jgi:hypothetical protein